MEILIDTPMGLEYAVFKAAKSPSSPSMAGNWGYNSTTIDQLDIGEGEWLVAKWIIWRAEEKILPRRR
jgi:hypothetical protein